MSSISIIGSGNMASAIGARAVEGGNAVEVIGRKAAKADALARALGSGATVGKFGAAPAGDIVTSPCRTPAPHRSSASPGTRWPARSSSTSATPLIRPTPGSSPLTAAPRHRRPPRPPPEGAHVVKAFNTLFGHVLAADQAGGRPLDVFIAGDDAEAKARVSSFIESLGLRPLDTGGHPGNWHRPEGRRLAGRPPAGAAPGGGQPKPRRR